FLGKAVHPAGDPFVLCNFVFICVHLCPSVVSTALLTCAFAETCSGVIVPENYVRQPATSRIVSTHGQGWAAEMRCPLSATRRACIAWIISSFCLLPRRRGSC